MACSYSKIISICIRSDLKAGGSVQKLHDVTDARLGGLREPSFQLLDNKEHQNLARESRAVLQSQQDELQGVLLHRCNVYTHTQVFRQRFKQVQEDRRRVSGVLRL